MEFEGTVLGVLPVVKGTSQRGEWSKQEVVFELPGEFNRKICVGFWGDKALDAGALKPGEVVTVSTNVESKEYNGRWYTEVKGWKMQRKTPIATTAPGAPGAPGAQMMPPLDAFLPEDSSEVDDLPF